MVGIDPVGTVPLGAVGAQDRDVQRIDSSRWTGTQFVLVDAKVMPKVRAHVRELHRTVDQMTFASNVESQNLKALVDALLAICEMAEPEVSIFDRILASPNFKSYATLLGIVATIRGALGI